MSQRAITAFRRNLIEAIGSDGSNTNEAAVLQLNAELMRLGYVLSEGAYRALAGCSVNTLKNTYADVVSYARHIKNDGNWKPLWKNFPNDVMSATLNQLYTVAILHYWTNGRFQPEHISTLRSTAPRGSVPEHKNYTTINLAPEGWMIAVARELAAFTKPLDPQSVLDLQFIVSQHPGIELENITVKETMAVVAAAGGRVKVRTPKDALRIAVALSGGDVSLAALPKVPKKKPRYSWQSPDVDGVQAARDAQKFKKFSRAERKMILGMLEGLKYLDAGDMQPDLGRWIRLGEVLHPGEYARQFPRAAAAFAELRNQKNGNKVRTFAGKVDMLFKTSVNDAIALLATRPGEFARRLDALLRSHSNAVVLDKFTEIVGDVSTKVLFEMYDHFEGRRRKQPRMVMVNGGSRVLEDLPPLEASTVDRIQKLIEDQMFQRAARLPKMGRVYIDDELFNMPIPYSMQSSSEGAVTMVRGTRTPIEDTTKVLRAYQFWHDTDGRIDLDLSAAFLNSNFDLVAECAFYDLRHGDYAFHSGDIRHRVGKNAEYIDVDLQKARKAGISYVLFNVYNYNGNAIASVKDAAFGVMERSAPKSNQIFDPATSTSSVKTTAKTTAYNPVIFDLVNNNWVWLDLENNGGQAGVRFGSQDLKALKTKLTAVLGNVKFSIANLLLLHTAARGGEVVKSREEADVVFTMDDVSKSYTSITPFIAI